MGVRISFYLLFLLKNPALISKIHHITQNHHELSPVRSRQLLSMSEPIILSDEEDQNALETPIQCPYKKIRTGPHRVAPTVLILDDDPTPKISGFAPSSSSTPSFVAETPMSDVCIIKCTSRSWLDPQIRVSNSDENLAGSFLFIYVCLKSK